MPSCFSFLSVGNTTCCAALSRGISPFLLISTAQPLNFFVNLGVFLDVIVRSNRFTQIYEIVMDQTSSKSLKGKHNLLMQFWL